jgi:MYXO-CTERM domain-containing protein
LLVLMLGLGGVLRRRRRAGGIAAATVAAVVLGLATTAGAQPTRVVIVGGAEPYGCEVPTACMGEDDCMLPGESCVTFDADVRACYARLPDQELFCCSSVKDCPTIGTAMPTECADVVGHESGEPTGMRVCRYPRADAICAERDLAPTDRDLETCLMSPGDRIVTRWVEGDCDDDGCKNGLDLAPCDPTMGCTPRPADAGTDAGGGELDSGMNGNDAGTAVDSGTTTRMDSGGGSGPPPGDVTYHGAGGCDCRTAGSRATTWPAALPALGLALLALRRRRGGRSRAESS